MTTLHRRSVLTLLGGAALWPLHLVAQPSTPPWREALGTVQPLGEGVFRWFGLPVYTARLWSGQRPFNPDAPFALELTYHLGIRRAQFINTSADEMQRLGALAPDAPQLLRWRTLMAEAFTDVEVGDQLVGVYLPGQGARFYNRSRRLASLDDPTFAQAFFAIWLDPRTRDAALRRQLMGGVP